MGLTPTEGLMMGTRVGDVDPGALVYLMLKHNLSATDLRKNHQQGERNGRRDRHLKRYARN